MAKWDAGRFLNTVSYFEAIPVVSDLQRWLTGGSNRKSTTNGGKAVGKILVVGAMTDIGQVLVQQLVKSGYTVRAAIADLSLAPFSIPAGVEYVMVAPDNNTSLSNSSLTDRVMQGVRAIIVCLDAEETLSTVALDNLTAAVNTYLPTNNRLELFDFTHPTIDLQATWGAVDDVVMGGVSESGIGMRAGVAVFSGNVSTDNSGGFASVRTRNLDPSLNLSNYQGIELKVKGDGQRYKIFLRTEEKWDGVGYAHSFDTIANEWMTIQVPFKGLVPIFRAKTVPNAPLDTTQICSFQLMLSKFEYDRALNPRFTPGLFSLEIESIAAYGGDTMPQLVVIDSTTSTDDLVAKLRTTNLPYSIVRAVNLDALMVAAIAVKSISQSEAVGQVLT
ncbi:CIA30 family protein [Chamaesiphon minutus]|uniref:Complex I intermediate-associated protein 30 (CIA30) n=1 Tax=Chamaesiphon minutus (strain ATCC 27169 / PCC 6605) TaxID=1173020 RepID=K9UG41_CHAP6|nr:CIA30 family protein [Chamaesiphon minutus]AFY94087.1 Complex I intermediate-associated protein 30 (CIA30) [Chamaesiphon minutus PCC 6605]